MSHLESILKDIDRIPPFSQVAQKAMRLIADPDVTSQALAEVIQFDQALTAAILKMCNSPYYALQRKISSVNEAVVVVGHNTLKDVIITCSTVDYFKGKAGGGYGHEEGGLWKHSVAAGIMGKLLAGYVKGVDAGEAFTTALMHDIGKLILSSFVADEFARITDMVSSRNYSLDEAEKEFLGATHAEIGAKVLEKWDFPTEMVLAVRQHHDQDVLKKDPLSVAVALSNILVVSAGMGSGIGGMATKIQGGGLKSFGLDAGHMDLLMAEWFLEIQKAQEIFDLQG